MSELQAANEAAENKGLISAREAAAKLGVSRATLCRLVKAKRLACFRIGTRVLFNHTILEEFMRTVYEAPADATERRSRQAA